ncbi:MAG: phosphohistidine phosphatase SixA, partial [Gammaproteobacteria bacterium]
AEGGLAPLDPVAPFAERLGAWQEDTLVAGHLPFLGKLVAKLVADDEDLPVVAFQPGSMVCLERGEGWSIAWMVRPELL